MKALTVFAAVAACFGSAFGYTPAAHTNVVVRDGVTYAQRGGLGAADYVVTNVDASAFVSGVASVNGKTGVVEIAASDVGAMPLSFGQTFLAGSGTTNINGCAFTIYCTTNWFFAAECKIGDRVCQMLYSTGRMVDPVGDEGARDWTYIPVSDTDKRKMQFGWKLYAHESSAIVGVYVYDESTQSYIVGSADNYVNISVYTHIPYSAHLYTDQAIFEYQDALNKSKFVSQQTTVNGKALSANVSLTASDVGAIDTNKLNTGMTWKSGSANWMNGTLTMGNGSTFQVNNTAKVWFINPDKVKMGSGLTYDLAPTLLSWMNTNETDPTVPAWAKSATPPESMTDNALVLTNNAVKTKGGTAVVASNVGAYPSASGVALASTVSNWERYWSGSNVVFEVTNYYGNTSGVLPTLRILELMEDEEGGTNYYKTVWKDDSKFEVYSTNLLAKVSASNQVLRTQMVGYVDGVAATKAPLAWGKVTDIGSVNEVSNSVWMTSPHTYFAGGLEYQRIAVGSGAICVLTTKGAPTYTGGEEGTFRFQDAGGTNYFGFAKSDSYTIGCNTDGIEVSSGVVQLTYNVIMGGDTYPIVYYCNNLTNIVWEQLNNADGSAVAGATYTVIWGTVGSSYVANLNVGNAPQGFFRAETSVTGDVKFETNMLADLQGGIVCTNTATGVSGRIKPTFNGSTVNWTWSAQ